MKTHFAKGIQVTMLSVLFVLSVVVGEQAGRNGQLASNATTGQSVHRQVLRLASWSVDRPDVREHREPHRPGVFHPCRVLAAGKWPHLLASI